MQTPDQFYVARDERAKRHTCTQTCRYVTNIFCKVLKRLFLFHQKDKLMTSRRPLGPSALNSDIQTQNYALKTRITNSWDVTPCILAYRYQRLGATKCIYLQRKNGSVTPCSPLEVHRRFGRTYFFQLHNLKVCLLLAGHLLGLFYDPEDGDNKHLRNVVNFYLTTCGYISGDRNFYSHRCENPKSNI
jgi:hypothetical protein